MSATPGTLPIIDSCDGCGACCRVVTLPPFYRVFEEFWEGAFERLKWERPDLMAEYLADNEALRASRGPFFGTPCTWLDTETGRCRHYDLRPFACQQFEVGGEDCRDARRRAGVG